MGHCEPASGIAGIMKTVLSLEHGVIPPILGLNRLNPNIDLCEGKLSIVESMTRWPAGSLMRASVNSFGYGGANAHTILESIETLAPGRGGVKAKTGDLSTNGVHGVQSSNGVTNGFVNGVDSHAKNGVKSNGTNGTNGTNGANGANGTNGVNGHHTPHYPNRRQFLLPFSAHNEATLRQNVAALRDCVDKYDVLDLAHTLGCRRSKLATRAFAVASQNDVASSLDVEGLVASKAMPGSRTLKLGFVFTGTSYVPFLLYFFSFLFLPLFFFFFFFTDLGEKSTFSSQYQDTERFTN
jgi:acyl transferase domain-containing protein